MTSISVSDLWNLDASPKTVEGLASSYRSLGKSIEDARKKVREDAHQVLGDEQWTGKTATSYGQHSDRLVGALADAGEQVSSMVTALEDAADVLRYNQQMLDSEFAKLSHIKVTRADGSLTFHPEGDSQTRQVNEAVGTAEDIRSRVDEKLEKVARDLSATRQRLGQIGQQWAPRRIRMINLNMAQGAGNSPNNEEGTDRSDLDGMADLIINGKADVVTLQEVFGADAKILERKLREKTGDNWTIHFGEASRKFYAGDTWIPTGVNEPFGNAIAVRDVDGVTATNLGPVKLDVPGDKLPGTDVKDEEGRSVTRVRLNFGQ